MARRPTAGGTTAGAADASVSSFDAMLLSAMERGDETLETGRHIVTYAQDATEATKEAMGTLSLRTIDSRDFRDQAVSSADVGEAEVLFFPEIGAAVVNDAEFAAKSEAMVLDAGNPVEVVEPEYFVFAEAGLSADYLRGFRRAVEAMMQDSGSADMLLLEDGEVDAEVLGATWGLKACRGPQSMRTGAGIKLAVLDTGMSLNHPDFAGRQFVTNTFVGQPVADLHGHGTHCMGTAGGPLSPPGTTPRYGLAHKAGPLCVGKVLSNSGSGATGGVLAGMNWAIAQGCTVISMSLGSSAPVQAAYTAAGRAALARGCLIVAAAGNSGAANPTGSPANSPTIMAVASLDTNLSPSTFSQSGKIEIAAPGRDVFSAAPLPRRYTTMSGTSMATPHVAGCAALWAQTSPTLRGQALWNKLLASAKPLPFPASRVGKGLVQAPP